MLRIKILLLCAMVFAGSAAVFTWAASAETAQLTGTSRERIRFEAVYTVSPGTVSHGFFNWLLGFLFGSPDRERPELKKPAGVGFDNAGDVIVSDLASNHVYLVPRDSTPWRRLDLDEHTPFQAPVSLAINNDTVFVVDAVAKTITLLDLHGAVLSTLHPDMRRPSALCVDSRGLYVADAVGNEVRVFDRTGHELRRFGLNGDTSQTFHTPTNIAIDHDTLCIVDAMNFRVALFSVGGTFLRSVGKAGDAPGSLSRPKGIAVDAGGNMFVVDALQGRVQVFSKQGDFLMTIGSEGSNAPGRFQLPSGIAIASNGRIAVADSYNHRVQVFQYLP